MSAFPSPDPAPPEAPSTPAMPAGPAQDAFHAFVSAADTATRAEAFASLIHAVRPGPESTWKGSALAALLDAVEAAGSPVTCCRRRATSAT